MIDAICYLAGIIVLAGCFGGSLRGRHEVFREGWMIYYSDGSWRVDTEHPEWIKQFRAKLEPTSRDGQ